ncbi:MAG: amidohydrolase family protein [Acidimicrobiales bacterium]|jgi:allantoinase
MPAVDLSILGRVVNGVSAPVRGEIRVAGGRIVEVREGEPASLSATRLIDVGTAYLLPGGIDCHVHSGSTTAEGIRALTAAAAAGGVTTVIDMPYDVAAPVVSPEILAAKRAKVLAEALVDVALLGTVRPGTGGVDVGPLVEAGAVGFKLSLFGTDPHRFPRIPDDQFLEVLAAIHEHGSVACVHAENEEIIKPLLARARESGDASPIDHCRSRPPVSETQAVLTALEYARETKAPLHLCHLSLARSVDLARSYAAEGLRVSTETCPHYLCFSEDDMERQRGRLKINPPLRPATEVARLWERLSGGGIDVVASDHAPWPLSEKTRPAIFDNHSGAPGTETLVTVLAAGLLDRGQDLNTLPHLVAAAPARIFGISHVKGSLMPGMDADIMAFDPGRPFTLDERQLHSNAGWSPYHGMAFPGRVILTVSRGEVVWDGSQLHGSPGRGRVVERPRGAPQGG